MQPNDLVRISLQCPELDFPIAHPFVKSKDLTAERLLTEIERVLQSYEEFVLDETLEIELVHVSLPDGGVGRSGNFVDLERHIKEKRSLIRIQNNDDMCCARALVTAKARIDGHKKWSSIRQGRKIQTDLVLSLHQEAGVPLAKYGVEEIKRFQAVMKEYQIHVISKDHFHAIIYEGPDAGNKIYLYLHDEYYDVITTMSGFLNKKYFCLQCKRGYDKKEKHKCNNPCNCCLHIHEDGLTNRKHCQDCNRYFKNDICYTLHKKQKASGKSTCKMHYRSIACSQHINKEMHRKPHTCGEEYCKMCKDFFDERHQCYIKPADRHSSTR